MKIPGKAQRVLDLLEAGGYEAYLVGGCVRDALLGKDWDDIDITTSARVEQTTRILREGGLKVVPTGAAHGTVTAILEGMPFEVTTFRVDGEYSDSRHPDSVRFCENVEDDLSRRDFTINAMAYSPARGLIDPHGGEADLEARTIRCVGDPRKRFTEDALRIMRALRFSAQLGFRIDDATAEAAVELRERLGNISMERISREFQKLMAYDAAPDVLEAFTPVFETFIPEITPTIGMDQHTPRHDLDVWGHTLKTLRMLDSQDLPTRFAALFHDMAKPLVEDPSKEERRFAGHAEAGGELCRKVMRRLKFPKSMTEETSRIVAAHGFKFANDPTDIKRWMNRLGSDVFLKTLDLKEADMRAHAPRFAAMVGKIAEIRESAEGILDRGEPYRVSDLAIGGADLVEAGLQRGPQMGEALEFLLDAVIDGKCANEKDALTVYACERFSRI